MSGAPWWWPAYGTPAYWTCFLVAAACALGAWQAHREAQELQQRIAQLQARESRLARVARRSVMRKRRHAVAAGS